MIDIVTDFQLVAPVFERDIPGRGYINLFRLAPDATVPVTYKLVTEIGGQSVHSSHGHLRLRYSGLPLLNLAGKV